MFSLGLGQRSRGQDRAEIGHFECSDPRDARRDLVALAPTVAYVDPAGGGTTGVFFAGLLARLGIADEINRKAIRPQRGAQVAEAVADGRAEIGNTNLTELVPHKGVEVIGLDFRAPRPRHRLCRRHFFSKHQPRGCAGVPGHADEPCGARDVQGGRAVRTRPPRLLLGGRRGLAAPSRAFRRKCWPNSSTSASGQEPPIALQKSLGQGQTYSPDRDRLSIQP